MITLEALNTLSQAEFVAALDGIFEHSAWVAERVAPLRPFGSRLQLLDAMRGAVQAASEPQQWALIRAHPQLGAGRARRSPLTEASAREQHRAGLDACSPAQFGRLEQLNAAYLDKFDFPFILAVRGHDPAAILARCELRLTRDRSLEQRTALAEIALIAGYRLAERVATPAGAEIMAMLERVQPGASLLREWMLAAGFELRLDGTEGMIGHLRGSNANAKTLLLGVHYDPGARALRCDGPLGIIISVAVAQQLRQQKLSTPCALALFARSLEQPAGSAASLTEPDALRGCVALTSAEAGGGEAAHVLAALHAAGLNAECLAMVRQGRDGLSYRDEPPIDARVAEGAARALQEFLLQTQPAGRHNGQLMQHG